MLAKKIASHKAYACGKTLGGELFQYFFAKKNIIGQKMSRNRGDWHDNLLANSTRLKTIEMMQSVLFLQRLDLTIIY